MAIISQPTLWDVIFSNENVRISIKISLKFVPEGLINNIPALVQVMAWCWPGDKPLYEPMMVRLLKHICITWPLWVKDICTSHSTQILTHLGLVSHICDMKNSSHFPSDAYMRHKSLYFSYRPRGRPTKQCQAKMSFNHSKIELFCKVLLHSGIPLSSMSVIKYHAWVL